MRLAILVCGEYREFETAHRSWDFLTKTENDVFFSTWETSIQENKGLNIYIEEKINEEKIKKIIPNAHISIVSDDVSRSLPNNTHRMHYHWKNALQLLESSGVKYTHMILIRPDIFFHNHREDYSIYDQLIKSNRLYGGERITLVGKELYGVDDTYFLGCFETMYKFINEIPLNTEMHDGLAKYIMNQGWFVEQLQIGAAIMRANCRGIENININDVSQKRHEWFVAFHKHKQKYIF